MSEGGSILKCGFENDDAKTIVFSFAGQGRGLVVGFEWVNFFSDRPVKVVCVRDRHKAYYMGNLYNENGEVVSNGIDSHVQLFKDIIKESKCERVIFTGSSLGGYASVLFGVLLNADYILPYSSQTFIREHPKYGKNERPHLAEWARRRASEEDKKRYFDLTDLDYSKFTGEIHYNWSNCWRDSRYAEHIKEWCETYERNKFGGEPDKGEVVDVKVHENASKHSKLCQMLKKWGILADHFDGIII